MREVCWESAVCRVRHRARKRTCRACWGVPGRLLSLERRRAARVDGGMRPRSIPDAKEDCGGSQRCTYAACRRGSCDAGRRFVLVVAIPTERVLRFAQATAARAYRTLDLLVFLQREGEEPDSLGRDSGLRSAREAD